MTKNRHHFFRFTPRTARITFIYTIVIPAITGYVAYQTDVSTITTADDGVTAWLTKLGTLVFLGEAQGR